MTESESQEKYYRVEEIAQMLRVNPRTIRQAINEGELKATRVGRLIRISQQQLDSYLRKFSS